MIKRRFSKGTSSVELLTEPRSLILTKACKFSNFFIELISLGSEVCGQGDTIRASCLLGSACINGKTTTADKM